MMRSAKLPVDGSTVTCPYHGAQFNVCTGAVLRGVGLLAVAGALVALAAVVRRVLEARRSRLPGATALVLALVIAAVAALLLLATTYDLDRGLTDRYAAALVLLVLGRL